MRGPFSARFLTYSPIPFVREIKVRFGCAVDPEIQLLPWHASEATRNLQLAVQDPGHPHSELGRELFRQDADDSAVRLPRIFAPHEEIWLFGARMPVDELPADTRDPWSIPPDLFCSDVRFESESRLRFDPRPANSLLDRQRQRIKIARRNDGVPVTAVLIQCNSSLLYEGDDDQPGTVVYSPDPAVAVKLLREWADRISDLKGREQTDPDLAMLSEYVTNETACPYRRRRIPKTLTDGAKIYIADLHIYRAFLPKGRLSGRDRLRCIAEPGSRGGALEHLEPPVQNADFASIRIPEPS